MSDVTLHGLETWHRNLVEKFGWTVIAVGKGNLHKGENFLQCLEHLINSIQLRLDGGIQSVDNHKDLEILLNNSNLLKQKAELILNLEYNSIQYPILPKPIDTNIVDIKSNYLKSNENKYGGKRISKRK
jgi:hypothetical protein